MPTTEPAEGFPARHEVSDGMRIDWQVPIVAGDGLILRADVYRPDSDELFPALLTYGPYAKGLSFKNGHPAHWEKMVTEHPDVAEGTTSKYASWEVADPEKWVRFGYAIVRVDSRGTGWSPGKIDHFCTRETLDMADCIEWAAEQPWCDGKVGLNGISDYAMTQYHVAALRPPHLVAMIPWEGAGDYYRDVTHHGGILCEFSGNWFERNIKPVQYGVGSRSPVNPNTGAHAAGPIDLDDDELRRNRTDYGEEIRIRPLDGP
jgi:putative CocE/NonD family hydrolase